MKYIYLTIGWLCVALGVIGIFVPLLPTTPFLLLAAALFVRSSPRMHAWLLTHKYLGTTLRRFYKERSISLRVKVISVCSMWIAILHALFFLAPAWYVCVALITVCAATTYYILSLKTAKGDE